METVMQQKQLAKEKDTAKGIIKISIKDDPRFKCLWDFKREPITENLKKIDPLSYIEFRKQIEK